MMKVVALAGGVGGAKLAYGLQALCGRELSVIVNTGDDFEHLGLHVSPDIDTVVYTLAGIANRQQGWGIEGESWSFLDQVTRLGGPDWFRLGDRDLAMHVLRTQSLKAGQTLSSFTADSARHLGVVADILPMSDDPVRTMIKGPDGDLAFQDYFVRLRCDVEVKGIRFAGIEKSSVPAPVVAALSEPMLEAVMICPSNPYVSVAPILAVPGMRDAIARSAAPVVAVSPIIGGSAVKGPAARMMRDLGQSVSALGVAEIYRGLIDGFVIDSVDRELADGIEKLGIKVLVTNTIMENDEDRVRLARESTGFAASLVKGG